MYVHEQDVQVVQLDRVRVRLSWEENSRDESLTEKSHLPESVVNGFVDLSFAAGAGRAEAESECRHVQLALLDSHELSSSDIELLVQLDIHP